MSNVQVRHPFNCKWLVRASISRACLNILDTRHDISFTAVVANSYPFDATATEFGRPLGILIFFLKQIVHEFWRRLVNYVAKKLVAPQAKFLKLQCQYAKNLWILVILSMKNLNCNDERFFKNRVQSVTDFSWILLVWMIICQQEVKSILECWNSPILNSASRAAK